MAEPGVVRDAARNAATAIEAIERFTRLIRHPLEPDVFERYWHFALLDDARGDPAAGAGGSLRGAGPRTVSRRAAVPPVARDRVGPAMDAARHRARRRGGEPPLAQVADDVRAALRGGHRLPVTAVEARIRFGFVSASPGRQRRGHDPPERRRDAADRRNRRSATCTSCSSGTSLQAMNKPDEAMAAYGNARRRSCRRRNRRASR